MLVLISTGIVLYLEKYQRLEKYYRKVSTTISSMTVSSTIKKVL